MRGENRYTAEIESLAFGGEGVARLDGCVVFVPGVLPGEKVLFRIAAARESYARGELLELLEPAADRIEPVCPFMIRPRGIGPCAPPVCPGCAYGHLPYARELAVKQAQFRDALIRLGGVANPVFRPPLASPRPLGYRNKITLHARKEGRETVLGYRAADSRAVLDVPACPLAAEPINDLLAALRDKPGFFNTLRDGMDVTVRWTEHDGALYWRGAPGAGEPWLRETTPGGPLLVPRGSFFQVNPWAAALLFETVRAILRQAAPARMVDLYCGVGFFSLAACRAGVARGAGVDSDPAAIAAAVQNGRRPGMTGFTFDAGDVEKGIGPLLAESPAASTLLLVDPPRTGLASSVTEAILRAAPRDLVYVSCAADTLARDLARLTAGGYHPKRLHLVDLFPRTPHFESVAWLRRGERRGAARPRARVRESREAA